ncbi:hypothetical protein R83H12_02967 [Fibrobacteria bacterium R8-3-H12]
MRNHFSNLVYAAAIGLALIFTLSCSSSIDSGDGSSSSVVPIVPSSSSSTPYVPPVTTPSSSSVTNSVLPPSSSSYSAPSSSSAEYTDGSCDASDYGTVEIGEQVWMAKNWGCYAQGSKCYDNDPANCATYGRLYDWATAMDIDAVYYGIEWGGSNVKHRGICPSGWHIPSDAEWSALTNFLGSNAGIPLKANSGWDHGSVPAGTDNYGFAALPGGSGNSDGGLGGIGNQGYWWSSTEYDASYAYFRKMSNNYADVYKYHFNKRYLLSVRCLKDSSSVPTQTGVIPGSPVTYDGETYETVVIGTQTWFKRNLNYAVAGSKCGDVSGRLSDANTATCATYGRLYDWSTAMALPDSCNYSTCALLVNAKHRGICPSGWHLPSIEEWGALMKFVNPSCYAFSSCAGAGTKLKAASGWNSYSGVPAGTDNYGFSALPGGHGYYNIDYVGDGDGNDGYWWSSSEHPLEGYRDGIAYCSSMNYHDEFANRCGSEKRSLLSVRCLQDE